MICTIMFYQGYKGVSRQYIATQGPMENTIEDFWRMMWEHRCEVIVMAVNFQERGIVRLIITSTGHYHQFTHCLYCRRNRLVIGLPRAVRSMVVWRLPCFSKQLTLTIARVCFNWGWLEVKRRGPSATTGSPAGPYKECLKQLNQY